MLTDPLPWRLHDAFQILHSLRYIALKSYLQTNSFPGIPGAPASR